MFKLSTGLIAAVAITAMSTTAYAQRTTGARAKPGARAYKSAVQSKVKEMKGWVWKDGTASYTEVVFRPGTKTKLLRHDAYDPGKGVNHGKLYQVSGSRSGKVNLTVLNNVSAHDLYRPGMSDSQFRTNVTNRIRGDRVRISIRTGDGKTRVLKDGVRSKDVTAIPLTVQLKKGLNEIRVDRTDARGRVMGASYMLGGRNVQIKWDGK